MLISSLPFFWCRVSIVTFCAQGHGAKNVLSIDIDFFPLPLPPPPLLLLLLLLL